MADAAEPKYCYEDGDIVLEVEATLYRIHSFHLQRATSYFDQEIQARREGNNSPLVLKDVKRSDLENLLWFFYESAYKWFGLVDESLRDQWESVLLLADKYEMRQVAIVASHALDRMGVLDDIRKISLCVKHVRDKDWALEELIRTVDRREPLNEHEGNQVGINMAIAISAARHAFQESKIPSVVGVCSSVPKCPQSHRYSSDSNGECFHGVHICEGGHRVVCPALGKLTARDAVLDVLSSQQDKLFAHTRTPCSLKRRVSGGAKQGDAAFMIEDKSYRLHSYHLKRASKVFADMYLLPKPIDADTPEERAITLDVKAADFANLIWFFYGSPYEWTPIVPYPSISQAKWESVLRLADMFDMEDVAQVATYALDRCGALSDMRKIALCVRHNIRREWAVEALKNVCSREEVMSVEEGVGLGVKMTVLVAQARERFYRGGSKANALEGIVREVILRE